MIPCHSITASMIRILLLMATSQVFLSAVKKKRMTMKALGTITRNSMRSSAMIIQTKKKRKIMLGRFRVSQMEEFPEARMERLVELMARRRWRNGSSMCWIVWRERILFKTPNDSWSFRRFESMDRLRCARLEFRSINVSAILPKLLPWMNSMMIRMPVVHQERR